MRRNAILLAIALLLPHLACERAWGQMQSMPPSGNVLRSPGIAEDGPRGRLVLSPMAEPPAAPLPGLESGDVVLRGPNGGMPGDGSIAPVMPAESGIMGSGYMEGLTSSSPYSEMRRPVGFPVGGDTPWTWQLLPSGIIYKSYLASTTEPRLGTTWSYLRGTGWVWNATAGARAGLLRYGTENDNWAEGWQLDIEAAGMPRLDAFQSRDMLASDFRVGVPLTFRRGPWEGKFGYYHLSSHIGDEYLIKHPDFPRLNYVRENLVLALAMRPHPDWRLYGEVAYAVYIDGGAKPWEFQFGTEFSPSMPTTKWGAPFGAVNGHLNQATNFSGNVNCQLGWAWRGETGHLLRVGAEYFNGMSDQGQFFRLFESRTGVGIWYDF